MTKTTPPEHRRFARTVTHAFEVRSVERFAVFDLGRDDAYLKIMGGRPIAECSTREEAERVAAALAAGALR